MIQFENTFYAIFLLIVPILIIRFIFILKWKKQGRKNFASQTLHPHLSLKKNDNAFIFNNLILIIAFLAIVFSLMNLLSGYRQKTVDQQGIDIVFALDLSNSMNANDISPSRIHKAKKIMEEIIQKLAGDRVGIVGFAEKAFSILPLTNDYFSAETFVENLDTQLLASQGTQLNNALEEASLSFDPRNPTSKVIILLSDGEDHHQETESVLKKLNKENITVISVAIGTEKGSTVPEIIDGVQIGYILDENGNVVISKRQDEILEKIAQETAGKIYVGENAKDTAEKIVSSFANLEKKSINKRLTWEAEQHFQIGIGIAFILILILSLTNLKKEFNI